VAAVLWRQVRNATLDTLTDQSGGQYHIAMTTDEGIEAFFTGVPRENPSDLGGYEVNVPIEAFDGPSPVSAEPLRLRYMGAASARQDWNIPRQRSRTAYPLWRPGRAFDPTARPADAAHALVLIRDDAGRFHARWLDTAAIAGLGGTLGERMRREGVGVWWANGGAMTTSDRARQVFDALRREHNVLLYGPPGTGKTHLLQEVQALFGADELWLDTAEERPALHGIAGAGVKVGFVTFHQSFGYEDFVVGLRPDPGSEKLLALEPVAGVLLELAEWARTPGHRSLLLVDEINRGNASRIFGELITLLDPDKRLAENGAERPTTVRLRLPYQRGGQPIVVKLDGASVAVPDPFTLPANLYLLATMNSVDKSVAPLDAALRRRFHVEWLGPDLAALTAALGAPPLDAEPALPDPLATPAHVATLGAALLRRLNDGIAWFLGPDFQLGHWYLAPLQGAVGAADAEARLVRVWEHRLFPQLEEFFHGRPDQLRALLRSPAADAPVGWRTPPDDLEELGATAIVTRRPASRETTIRFLRKVAGVRVQAVAVHPVAVDPVATVSTGGAAGLAAPPETPPAAPAATPGT
jgi:hypothetical protein